jgi:hypothetical protein
MNATWTKLKIGGWGARVEGSAKQGDELTITRRDGAVAVRWVNAVVWSGQGVTLCTVTDVNPNPPAPPEDDGNPYAELGVGYFAPEDGADADDWALAAEIAADMLAERAADWT